jgi:hypothetical protein
LGHVTSNETWATVDLNTSNGQVFIQEDWFYNWNLWPGVTTGWTYPEKRATHNRIDRAIWGVWSNNVRLGVSGTSAFAKQFRNTGVPVNFDIRWDIKLPAHWQVKVWKMAPGTDPAFPHRSFVDPPRNIIELNTADLRPNSAGNAAGANTTKFVTPPHEFGHTIGPGGIVLQDEYNAGHPNLGDSQSIMNIGNKIRRRHLVDVVKILNRLMPGTTFDATRMLV